jgi:hypothetical protein
MKLTKMFGLVAVAALALMAFASTASATTLETNGLKKAEAITIEASLNGSATLSDTSNTFANTCKTSTVEGKDSTAFTATGTKPISGPVSTLSFGGCTHEEVKVDKPGSLSVEWISGTTNGTVRSTGAEVTVPATIGSSIITVNCTTSGTDIGTLKGVKEGTATMEISAVLNCGFFLPSAKWVGTYNLTSGGKGHALGVVE